MKKNKKFTNMDFMGLISSELHRYTEFDGKYLRAEGDYITDGEFKITWNNHNKNLGEWLCADLDDVIEVKLETHNYITEFQLNIGEFANKLEVLFGRENIPFITPYAFVAEAIVEKIIEFSEEYK